MVEKVLETVDADAPEGEEMSMGVWVPVCMGLEGNQNSRYGRNSAKCSANRSG